MPEVPVDEEEGEVSRKLEEDSNNEFASNSKLFKNKQKRKSIQEKTPKVLINKKQYKLAFEPVYGKKLVLPFQEKQLLWPV